MLGDLKLIAEVIFSIILINVVFCGILISFYIYDTKDKKQENVDSDYYTQDMLNNDLNQNTQTEDDYITMHDSEYIPGESNPFSEN